VVFRDGVAVGLIDFDFAAPGAPLWDVGATARMWAPLVDPAYRPHWPGGVDEARRLGLFARAFGVGPDDASAFVDLLMSIHTRTRAAVRRRVERGEPAFVAMWNAHGGEEREGVDLAWLDRNRAALVDAVARGGGTD
jgi:aminoglycoside phosphotransferase (APT) family kinase protein